MKSHILALLAAAVLAGCQTMTPEERRAADEATCRSYGFDQRNDAFAECMQRLDLDRRAARRHHFSEFDRAGPVIIYRPIPVYD